MISFKKNEIFRGEKPIESSLNLFNCLDKAGKFTSPWKDVYHPYQPFIIHKNVFWFYIAYFFAVLADILLGSCQSKEQKPQLWLFEELPFRLALLDEIWEQIGKIRVLSLYSSTVTVRVPVFPQSPISLLKPARSGKSKKSDFILLGPFKFLFH